ncbi:MAG: hypothetical protein R2849_19985 [Thermomicrobiales bacterium]
MTVSQEAGRRSIPSTKASATTGEQCDVTVLGAQISDDDSIDPPDAMDSDYLFQLHDRPAADGGVDQSGR